MSIFKKEEEEVEAEFNRIFRNNIDLLLQICHLIEQNLKRSRTPADDFSRYASILLIASCLKSYIGALDRLSKGYISDSEALFKKAIEGFFYQTHFYLNSSDAKMWCQNNQKPKKLNYFQIAEKLDKVQFDKKFFPTNYENFFSEYIYKIGYRQANRLAHLDFDLLHYEMGLDNENPSRLATTLVLGPRFEVNLMRTSLSRLIMFSMFQLSMLIYVSDLNEDDQYTSILRKVLSADFLISSPDSH